MVLIAVSHHASILPHRGNFCPCCCFPSGEVEKVYWPQDHHSPGGRSGSLGAACWMRRGLATALELSETLRLVELEPLSWSSWGKCKKKINKIIKIKKSIWWWSQDSRTEFWNSSGIMFVTPDKALLPWDITHITSISLYLCPKYDCAVTIKFYLSSLILSSVS